MIIDARTLTNLQRCARLPRLGEDGQIQRWNPTELFAAVLRKAVFELSAGTAKETVVHGSVASFMEECAAPGLDTLSDPYSLAADLSACLQTVLEALSRLTLLVLKEGPTLALTDGLSWRVAAFQDESGVIHRWAVINELSDDSLSRELHSWYVFGDIAAADAPMTLHLVELGHRRGAHQHTQWCKAYKHPMIANQFRFQKVRGEKLTGDWKPVFYADSPNNSPESWVNAMERDRVRPIHHVNVKQISAEQREVFVKQVQGEADRMNGLPEDWRQIPMSRHACHMPTDCQRIYSCYQ